MATPRPFAQIPDEIDPKDLSKYLRVMQNAFAAAIADVEGRIRPEHPATQKRLPSRPGERVSNALYAMEGAVSLDKARMGADGDVLYLIDGGRSAVWGNGVTPAPTGGGTGPSVTVPHPLLDGVQDNDTLAGTVVRGDVIVGNATPKWARVGKGSGGQFFRMNGAGTDPNWETVAYQNLLLDGVNHTDTAAPSPLLRGEMIVYSGSNLWTGLPFASKVDSYLRSGSLDPAWVEGVAKTGAAKVDATAQTADIAATNLMASGHTAGLYRVDVVLLTTTNDAAAGTLAVTIGWTDNAGATTSVPITTHALTVTGRTPASVLLRSTGAAAVTYAVAVTGSYGTSQYAVYVRTLFLG